jgi:hypothetical protein
MVIGIHVVKLEAGTALTAIYLALPGDLGEPARQPGILCPAVVFPARSCRPPTVIFIRSLAPFHPGN